jgi:uncharacterized phage protein gp47/JayE
MFKRPTLAEILARINGDIESRLEGADAKLRRNVLNILGRSLGGAAHGLHGHLDDLARQLMPDTADAEYLERWASIWGPSRKPSVAAKGNVTFTGTNGVTIPAGTLLQRSDGTEFTTDADGGIVAGVATVAVTAVLQSVGDLYGSLGNTAAGSALSLVNPLAGVNGQATAVTGLSGGVDVELDEDLRARLLDRIRRPPMGGADSDYEAWALEVAGVTRAWPYANHLGLGTVGVAIMMDDTYADGIPLPADVITVADYIERHVDPASGEIVGRPITAAVTVFAPVAVPLDFTLSVTPDTAEVRAQVEAELADLLRLEAAPGGRIAHTHLNAAISAASGETDHVLTLPAADVLHLTGEIAVMGVVTWA